ncbi:hypothetical protein Tco_1023115, partial [Tanacetum coccineum]
MESVQDMKGCRDDQKVKYTAGHLSVRLLRGGTLRHTRGRETAVGMAWEDFKTFTREDIYPVNEMLVRHLVTPENKRIERYIYGLASQIRGMVTTTEPVTIQKAMPKAGTLTDEAIRNGLLKKNPNKRCKGGEPS